VSVVTGAVPTVTLDSPVDNPLTTDVDETSFTLGDLIDLEITAADLAPGFITKVEILNGADVLGEASLLDGDQFRYRIDTATAGLAVGTYNLSAQATDNSGNVVVSDLVAVNLKQLAFAVRFTDSSVLASDPSLGVTYNFEVEVDVLDPTTVESVAWLVDDVEVARSTDNAGGTVYSQEITLTGTSQQEITVTAVATNTFGGKVEVIQLIELNFVPEVSILKPLEGAFFGQGSVVAVEISASDSDGSIETVEVYEGEVLQGAAVLDDDTKTYHFEYLASTPRVVNLQARATDDLGSIGNSTIVAFTVVPPFSVTFTDPTSNPFTLVSDSYLNGTHTFKIEVAGLETTTVQSVAWLIDGVVAANDLNGGSLAYSQELTLKKSGVVTALVTDTIGVEQQVSVAVVLSFAEPPSDDEFFVIDVYQRLFGSEPTAAQLATALEVLKGTLDSRVSFLQQLFDSAEMDENEMVMMVNRTMTGEWPDATELAALRDGTSGSSAGSSSESGNIAAGQTQSFEFYFTAGDRVTLRVLGDSSNGNALNDPTLTLNGPSGAQVAFDDDSGTGLNPLLDYTATEAGTHTAIVAGWASFSEGDFVIDRIAFNSSDSDAVSAQSLVQELIPDFEARFGLTFPTTSDVTGPSATNLMNQLFVNKHDAAADISSQTRLYGSLTGPESTSGGLALPGYSGNLIAFTAAFAQDNKLTQYGAATLSSVHYYTLPNRPVDEVPLALLVSTFLEVDPTDAVLANYAGMAQAAAFAAILEDSRYSDDTVNSNGSDDSVASFVALAMAEAGAYQLGESAPEDDADGDGQSNLEEIAFGGDPGDASDQVAPLEVSVVGSDFVVSFIRIQASEVLTVYVECSEDLINWGDLENIAHTVKVVEDSSVAEGYERVELSISMKDNCAFVRLAVDLP